MSWKSSRIENAHDDAIWSVNWASDTELLSGSLDGYVKQWTVSNSEMKYRYEGHSWGISSIASHVDSNKFASVSLDSQLKVWDSSTGKKIQEIDCSETETYGTAIHPNGDLVASTKHTGGVTFYDANTGESKQSLSLPETAFTFSTSFSPNGLYVACSSWTSKRGLVSLFEVETGKLLHNIEAHAMPIRSVTFSRDSNLILSASDDKHVNIYDISSMSNPNLQASVSGHGSWVLAVACSHDYKYFATSSSDRTVKVWDMGTRQCLQTYDLHSDQVWSLAWNSKGDLAAVSADKSISIYTQQ